MLFTKNKVKANKEAAIKLFLERYSNPEDGLDIARGFGGVVVNGKIFRIQASCCDSGMMVWSTKDYHVFRGGTIPEFYAKYLKNGKLFGYTAYRQDAFGRIIEYKLNDIRKLWDHLIYKGTAGVKWEHLRKLCSKEHGSTKVIIKQ